MSLMSRIFGSGKNAPVVRPAPVAPGTLGSKSSTIATSYQVLHPDPEPGSAGEYLTDNDRREEGQAPDESKARKARLREQERQARKRGTSIPLPPDFRRIVAKQAKVELCTASERAQLHAIEGRWRSGCELLSRLCDDRNRPAKAARRMLEEALDAEAKVFLSADAWSPGDIREDANEKIRLVKQRLKEIAAESIPILEPIFSRLADAADDLADGEEKAERDRLAKWSLPYSPSAIVRCLRQFAWQLPEQLPDAKFASVPPSNLLPEAFQ